MARAMTVPADLCRVPTTPASSLTAHGTRCEEGEGGAQTMLASASPSPSPSPVADLLASLLDVLANDTALEPTPSSPFKCTAPLPITIHAYAHRLAHFLALPDDTLLHVTALVLRLFVTRRELFCHRSVHKLLAAATVVSCKFVDDHFHRLPYAFFAECAGVGKEELSELEVALLFDLEFRAMVDEADAANARAVLEVLAERATQPSPAHAPEDGKDDRGERERRFARDCSPPPAKRLASTAQGTPTRAPERAA